MSVGKVGGECNWITFVVRTIKLSLIAHSRRVSLIAHPIFMRLRF